MPLPQNQVDNINGKISSLKGYKEVQSGVKKLQNKGSSFQDAAKDKAKGITSAVQDKKKQFQQQAQSQLDQILQLITINTGQSSATVNELKNIFNKVVISTYRRIPEILFEEAINAIGCSQQQEFQGQVLYVRVQSIDLQKMLFINNAIDDGWAVKKKNEKYIFSKKHENKKEVYLETYLQKFIEENLKVKG